MRFSDLPLRLRLLLLVQTAVAVLTVYRAWDLPPAAKWSLLAFLMLCGAVGGACKVDVNVRYGRLSLGFTVTYFALLLLGTTAAVLVSFSSALTGTIFNLKEEQRRIHLLKAVSAQSIYNTGNCVLATLVMGSVYQALGGRFGYIDVQTMALPIIASALCYYLVNIGGVTLAIGWSQGIDPREVFRNNFSWSWPGFLAGACISAGLLWTYQTTAFHIQPSLLLLFPPAYLVYHLYSFRSEKMQADVEHMREMNRLNDAVISSLAMAIDAKDRHTGQHVDRVREYAVRLAGRLGVGADEVQAIRIASLLHDIGKIGIPERILCKQGKLTSEEFEIIKSHVAIGAAILDQIQFPWPVVEVVRTHHERWDGLGYPAGLKGEEIPIGGRIISLVDVFDALTSDRPYRRAISREQAIEILRASSGSQFDPKVVDTFVTMLPEMDAAIRELERRPQDDTAALIASVAERAARVQMPEVSDEEEDAVVLGALSELLQDRPQLHALAPRLAECIARLVPYSTFALFVSNPEHRTLVPIHAAGLWTGLLAGMEMRLGEGISGLVAVTGEPVMNASATLDLARRLRPCDNLELNSTLCVPLRVGERIVGTLTVYHSSYNFYQPYHQQRLERVARYTMQALDTGGLLGEDFQLPQEDPATRLPNAHALSQFVYGQLQVAQTREDEFAVVLLRMPSQDVTGESGDRPEWILPVLGRLLQDTVRDGDYVARASSSEFAVVLPRCGEREASVIAQRLVERVQAARWGGVRGPLSLQVGLSLYPRDGAAPQSLLIAAERRLAGGEPTADRSPTRETAVGGQN